MASINCDPSLGVNSRCPHCGFFHLRPGYCWALDLVNNPHGLSTIPPKTVDRQAPLVDKKASVDITPVDITNAVDTTAVVDTVIEPDEEEVDKAERRRRQQREWARRKRAGEP